MVAEALYVYGHLKREPANWSVVLPPNSITGSGFAYGGLRFALVDNTGVEPVLRVCHTRVLPLTLIAHNTVALPISQQGTTVPFNLRVLISRSSGVVRDSNPRSSRPQRDALVQLS